MRVDIVQTKMEKTCYARQQQGVNDICADHDFRLKAEEQQQQHHHNTARTDRSDAYQETGHESDEQHPRERLHRRRLSGSAIFDFLLKEQEGWNANQQDSDGNGDEVIDAISVNSPQINQETYSRVRTRGAAADQR